MASEIHDRILKGMLQYFEEQGYTIHCVDLNGYEKCENVPTHVPDIIAVDPKGLWHIGEAESCKALERYQTIKQFNALSNLIMPNIDDREIPFYVGIPERCEIKLKNILKEQNIDSKVHLLLFHI